MKCCCKSSDIAKANAFLPPVEPVVPPQNFCYYLKLLLEKLEIKGAVGIPGTSTLYFYEQIEYDPLWQKSFFSHHEMNSGFMADGSVRGSRYGERNFFLSFATTGPGSTNIVTPVADSILDSIPAIHLVNDVGDLDAGSVYNIYRNRYIQNIPPENIFGGLAKSIFRMVVSNIQDGSVIGGILESFQKAFSYPKGASILVLTSNSGNYVPTASEAAVLLKEIDNVPSFFTSPVGIELKPEYVIAAPNFVSGYLVPGVWERMISGFNEQHASQVVTTSPFDFLNETLLGKTKPLVIFGIGAERYLSSLIDFFTHTAKIPHIVTLPLMGYIRPHPYAVGRCGHTAEYQGNLTAYNCDWVLCIGNSFNVYQVPSNDVANNFANASNIISWNLYPQLTDVPYVTNYIIQDAADVLKWTPVDQGNYDSWIQQISAWRAEGNLLLQPVFYKKSPFLQYGTVFSVVQNIADHFLEEYPTRQVWLVSDAGLHQPLGCSLFIFRDDRYKFVTGGKLAAIGGGLGIAMGVAMANPDDLVILYSGETGFQLASPDWISLTESKITNMVIFVFENSGIGLIEEEDLEQKSGNLLDANGYVNTMDWKSVFSGNLFRHYIWTDNLQETAEAVAKKIPRHWFKNVFVTLCVVEYDVYYSPLVGLGDSFVNMQYFPASPDNAEFQKKRIQLIKYCCPQP